MWLAASAAVIYAAVMNCRQMVLSSDAGPKEATLVVCSVELAVCKTLAFLPRDAEQALARKEGRSSLSSDLIDQ